MTQPRARKRAGLKLLVFLILLTGLAGCSDRGDDPPTRPPGSSARAVVLPGVNPDFTMVHEVELITGATPADAVRLTEGVDWSWDNETLQVRLYGDLGYPLYLNLTGEAQDHCYALSTYIPYAGAFVAANEITTLAVKLMLDNDLPCDRAVQFLCEQFSIEADPFAPCLSAERDDTLTRAMQGLMANFEADSPEAAGQLLYGLDMDHVVIDAQSGTAATIAGMAHETIYGQVPLEISFANLSMGTITGYTWNFGDGQISSERSPVHRFDAPGAYPVTLTVAGEDQTLTAESMIYAMSSLTDPPEVALTASDDSGGTPLTVAFGVQSDDAVNGCIWDFGDGTIGSGMNPEHIYTAAGRHLATVKAIGDTGVAVSRKVIHAGRFTAVIATAATDFSAGAHTIVDVETLDARSNILPTTSDITMVAHKDCFYRIERYLHDSIAKFSIDDPETVIWQYSALEPDVDGASSNPYDLVFLNDHKAYLIRYGSARAWIVNPSAADETAFKTGEIDLGDYGDQDGLPEMSGAVLVGKKLYIAMQRMDRTHISGIWQPNRAYVAVFDTDTDTEIDTGYLMENEVTGTPLKGIPLEIENPISMQFLPENQTIYVQGVGTYPMAGYIGKDTGGIEAVDPEDHSTLLVLDDGERIADGDALPWGNISGMVLASPEKGYFVGYKGWNDNTLYAFDLDEYGQADVGSITSLDFLAGKNITVMEAGVGVDNRGRLWVSNRTDNGIAIIDPETDTQSDFAGTGLPPLKTVFCIR